jgi:hypothetical protein
MDMFSNSIGFVMRQLAVLGLATFAFASVAGDEPVLKEADQRNLGSLIRSFLDAKDTKASEKARAALSDALTRLGKNLKKGDPMQAALSLTSDLGKAFYYHEDHKMSGVHPGEIAIGSFDVAVHEKNEKVTYAVWTPKTYKASGDPLPVVLFVPGMKDGKVYGAKQFLMDNWTDQSIHDKALLVAVDMPEDPKLWGQMPTEDDEHQGGVSVVMRTFGKIRDIYTVDHDRFYLAGRETGVPVVLKIANLYPHRFAGVIGQLGDAPELAYDNFRNLPTFFAGGATGCTTFQEKTKALGFDNCTIKQDGTDVDAWTWTQDHKRIANPTKVSLVLGPPFQAYWIVTLPQEVTAGTRVDAEVDRASNKLVINAKNVKQVTVYFNDVLLDLDKPVKVVCNGVEREDKIARNLDDLLTYIKVSTCDGGRIYVASKSYDMPPAKE